MSGTERRVVLLIADISGYTRFMLATREELAHGQVLLNELLAAVLREAELPLVVAKLEGDAVFLYAERSALHGADTDSPGVGERILRFFDAFYTRLADLAGANLCHCRACASLRELRLKVVVHSGTALFYRLDRFEELSGPDVILVHRLLKNSVKEETYILATDSAFQELSFPKGCPFTPAQEVLEGLGRIAVRVGIPSLGVALPETPVQRLTWHRFKRELAKYRRALPFRLGIRRVLLGREQSPTGGRSGADAPGG